MIIYGRNTKNIKQAPLENHECPNCKERNSHVAVFAHYGHIFWIPLFPYKKTIQIYCSHCQLATEESAMQAEMKEKMKQLKSSVGIPKYLFSGLVIIALAISYFAYSGHQQGNLEAEYIANPQVGDVYIIKTLTEKSEYNHYLMKVNSIANDSLIVSFSSYSYNGLVDKLDPADGFYNVTYVIHKDEIKNFDLSGELKKVMREYSSSAGFDRIIEFKPEEGTESNTE
jgi:hypothetical protein